MKIAILLGSEEPIYQSLERAFRESGHEVVLLSILAPISFSDLRSKLLIFDPDFCFCVNFYPFDITQSWGADLECFLEENEIPCGSLFWDAPWATGTFSLLQRMAKGPFPKRFLFFVIDRGHETFFRQRGMNSVLLPSAVDRIFFDSKPSSDLCREFSFPLFFSGSPPKQILYRVEDREQIRRAYLKTIMGEFQYWLLNYGGFDATAINGMTEKFAPLLSEFILEERAESFYALRFQRLMNQLRTCLSEEAYQIAERYRGRFDYFFSTMGLNLTLHELMPLGLHGFGGEEWSKFLLPCLPELSRRLSAEELIASYASSKIVFCMTKIQLGNAVHERPLQVLASGGFPLTDRVGDLRAYFDEDEIISYGNLEEAADLIRHYLTHDKERSEIARRGRERVLAQHTYHQRVPTIVREMSQTFDL